MIYLLIISIVSYKSSLNYLNIAQDKKYMSYNTNSNKYNSLYSNSSDSTSSTNSNSSDSLNSKFNIKIEDVNPIFHDKNGVKIKDNNLNISKEHEKILVESEAKAIDYARRRSAELIGKRILKDGTIIDNPNAKFSITDTTRDGLKKLIEKAMREGWSNDELADNIEKDYNFSNKRAMTIARTETNLADNNLSVETYKKAGIKQKKWLTANDDKVDTHCIKNQQQGVINIDMKFLSGHIAPPTHPNCRCTILPYISE